MKHLLDNTEAFDRVNDVELHCEPKKYTEMFFDTKPDLLW